MEKSPRRMGRQKRSKRRIRDIPFWREISIRWERDPQWYNVSGSTKPPRYSPTIIKKHVTTILATGPSYTNYLGHANFVPLCKKTASHSSKSVKSVRDMSTYITPQLRSFTPWHHHDISTSRRRYSNPILAGVWETKILDCRNWLIHNMERGRGFLQDYNKISLLFLLENNDVKVRITRRQCH